MLRCTASTTAASTQARCSYSSYWTFTDVAVTQGIGPRIPMRSKTSPYHLGPSPKSTRSKAK